jgi:bacterioferritin (cytochrome b1)
MTTDVDDLNKCLRGELSAMETYRQALDKAREDDHYSGEVQQLSRILEDHRSAASKLRTVIAQMGGTPSDDSGAWGAWSKAVMGTAKLFGDTAALKALKEGEESGLKDYRNVTGGANAPAGLRSDIAALASKNEEHIRTLDRLIDAVGQLNRATTPSARTGSADVRR